MLKVLINAYAVAPNWGSEQGMGWNWILQIARYCKVYVITEGEWRDDIEKALELLPQKVNIQFYYNPVSPRVRRMCWNQGDYRFYIYYARWQKQAVKIAHEIMREHKIDVIHQLNMVGFREPGQLWRIKDVPYVWGPFSGCMPIKMNYVRDCGLLVRMRYLLKNCLNWYQFRYLRKVRNAFKRADGLITTDKQIRRLVKDLYGKDALLISETGLQGGCVPVDTLCRTEGEYLNLLWVGRFIKTKKLDIALRTIAELGTKKVRLYVVGFGAPAEEALYKRMAHDLGIEDKVIWLGRQENTKVKDLMKKMDVLFFTSVLEATSTVVPEAIQNRLPVVCHDCCGFGPLIDDKIGFKIALTNPQQSIADFSKVIGDLCEHRELLSVMKFNFDKIAQGLTYEWKGERVVDLYKSIIINKSHCGL